MTTFFLPDERHAYPQVLRQAEVFRQSSIGAVFDKLPYIILILNNLRQIIHYNRNFIPLAAQCRQGNAIGLRPGEALNCAFRPDLPSGCGTGWKCRSCGAALALKSAAEGAHIPHECRLRWSSGKDTECLDLRVWTEDLEFGGEKFTIFTFSDISDEKQRQALERTFFHDILNTASAVYGLLELCRAVPDGRHQKIDHAARHFGRLVDGIHAQRDLLAAERGELHPDRRKMRTREPLETIAALYRESRFARRVTIDVDALSADTELKSDPVLVSRVIENMLKNALEAEPPGGTVALGCTENGAAVTFWVRNSAVIPQSARHQIFQRFFSTKGSGRGLGTYGMKLLGEKYLGGSVSFTTSEDEGTVFRLVLPKGARKEGTDDVQDSVGS